MVFVTIFGQYYIVKSPFHHFNGFKDIQFKIKYCLYESHRSWALDPLSLVHNTPNFNDLHMLSCCIRCIIFQICTTLFGPFLASDPKMSCRSKALKMRISLVYLNWAGGPSRCKVTGSWKRIKKEKKKKVKKIDVADSKPKFVTSSTFCKHSRQANTY